MPQEQKEFLKEFEPEQKQDVFEQPLTPEAEKPVEEEAPEESKEEATNRRERRLQAKLQAERESSIALAARLEALTEAQKFSQATDPEFAETVERIYGNATPEAAEATNLLKKALASVKETARDEAIEAFREEQRQAREAEQAELKNLDGMVEEIEDEYGVTLDKSTQQAFFQRLEKLSPKDGDGNIIAYADHHAVWEDLQSRKAAPNTRAKDLASRGMVKTGATAAQGVGPDANEKWLRENGII